MSSNKIKIPKKVLGFKLSKGTRKDLRKLTGMLETPEAKALAMSAIAAVLTHLGDKMAERHVSISKIADKAAKLVQPH